MKIQIIIGSTRPGRVTDRMARWIAAEAKNLPNADIEIVDLADYTMPYLDEPMSPQYNPDRKPNPQAKIWMDKLATADAYLIVTPEYNRSIPGVLKNALDYLDFQFAKKPVALVGHGSSGGAQAVANLRGILSGLKSFATPTTIYFVGQAGELIDEAGNLSEQLKSQPYGPQATLKATLQELAWYANALATARAQESS